MVYGVAHGEIASINCTVRANPAAELLFRWTFNSSSELNQLPANRFRTSGTTSTVRMSNIIARATYRRTYTASISAIVGVQPQHWS